MKIHPIIRIKYAVLTAVVFLSVLCITDAQVLDPVSWEYRYERIGENEIELVFTATIEDTWHLYSQDIPEGGPIPTSFTIEESGQFELIGPVNEVSEPEEKYDASFDMVVKLFSHNAVFRQRVKLLSGADIRINGSVEFMSCDDQRCLPPKEDDFTFLIAPVEEGGIVAVADDKETAKESVFFESQVDL